MRPELDWSRRRFLRAALRTFGGAGVVAGAGSVLDDLHGIELPEAAAPGGLEPQPDGHAALITGDVAADHILGTALDAIFPAQGPGPSATQARVAAHLAEVAAAPEFQGLRALWRQTAPLLDAAARQRLGAELSALPAGQAATILGDCCAGRIGDTRSAPRLRALALSLLEFGIEGYFGHPRHGGNPDGVVWKAYGLAQMVATLAPAPHHARPGPLRSSPATDDPDRLLGRTWDAIVVGSGAGGAALAWRLATRGLTVLVLEKGASIEPGPLVHDEIAVTRRNLFVPYVKDEPHVVVAEPGAPPERRRDGWTACCVGGGTVHMGAMLLRMHPADFQGADGQAAWPFGYDAMRPYYDLVEQAIGSSGARDANPFEAPGPPFPLPPIDAHPAAHRLAAAARAAGWHPYPTPRGILSRPHGERGACAYCPFCASYACEVDAKAGADVTFLRQAQATGRAAVLAGVRVTAVELNGQRATGVEVIDAAGTRRTVVGTVVILAAGAVESARVALRSTGAAAPAGIGNQRGQVGRNLTGSYNAGVAGRFEFPGQLFAVPDDGHPFLNLALQDLYAGGCGTLVLDRRPVSPIHHALLVATAAAPQPLLGAALKERLFLELAGSRSVVVESFIPMRPHPERRMALDERTVDAWGLPVAKLTFARDDDDRRRGRRVVQVGDALLRAAGAADCDFAIEIEETPFLLSGTMRMGADAAASVTDPHGRVHGLANVFACDGSVLPGMGGVPPTLTIMANAIRIADAIRANSV